MEQILIRQNEDIMLQIQYSARFCYNKAERFHCALWALCILSWLSAFLPSSTPEHLLLAIPFTLDTMAAICEWIFIKSVSSAAKLRSYFDAYVFELDLKDYSRDLVQELKVLSSRIVANHPQDAAIQMTHTGKDTPPGVKDWYDGYLPQSKKYDAIYECQRQNYWWDKKLAWTRLICSVFFGLVIIFFCVLLFLQGLDAIRLILCSGGLLLKLFARIAANVSYMAFSIKIEGIVENLSDSRTVKNIRNLQAKINERRALPILGQNRVHKHLAKRLSELYQTANKG